MEECGQYTCVIAKLILWRAFNQSASFFDIFPRQRRRAWKWRFSGCWCLWSSTDFPVELEELELHFVNRQATDVCSMMLKYCKIEAVNMESVHYMGNSQEHIFTLVVPVFRNSDSVSRTGNIVALGTSFSARKILVTTRNHLRDLNERTILKRILSQCNVEVRLVFCCVKIRSSEY